MRLTKLRELARLHSIQITYDDAAGKKKYASREALLAALRMRVPEGVDLDDALRERKRAFWMRGIEPVIVVWGRRTPLVELRLPQTLADRPIEWSISLENGETREGRVSADVEWKEDEFVGKTIRIDQRLPHGYHTLRVSVGDLSWEALVIAAPFKAYEPKERTWGIFAPLYSAHTRRSWGAGDLGDLERWRAWVQELGGGVVATLPMLASFENEPSPYSPVSRLFWNELYLDVTRVPEFDPADVDENALRRLRAAEDVDYAGVMREKRRALETMAARFTGTFDESTRDYAEFRARHEQRDSAHYHRYVQHRMAEQMRAIDGLYLDFPLGTHPHGFDARRYADSFAKGVSVGAPPDLFFTKGQNWGFPPLDPDAIRERRYDYFRAAIRHHVSHASILRLDHVMGLHRLFWIPDGGEAKDGVYVRYAEEELYAIVTLESTRHRCAIVGEDLGTVPPYVPKMMSRHGLRRMYVVQYESKLDDPPRESVASVNTHDMPTFAAWWDAKDVDDRLAQGLLDERGASEEREARARLREAMIDALTARGLLQRGVEDTVAILEAVLAFLSGSASELVLVNVEDLWLAPEPQNVPGVPERSWRRKFRLGLDEAREDTAVTRILRTVNDRRRKVDGYET